MCDGTLERMKGLYEKKKTGKGNKKTDIFSSLFWYGD